MKFPTKQRLLPELTLSESEQAQHVTLAKTLVARTIAQYEDYDAVYNRQVSREQWKPVKHRESLTVYKQKKWPRPKQMAPRHGAHSSSSSNSSASSSARPQTTWSVPTLFMVGTIVGTLDDVMYGVATFDAPSMLLKTTYTHDELVDGEILNQIHGPTGDDPFRFLGLKWIVKGSPAAVSKIVRPRDLVFLESTGIDQLENGDRVGYHLMHSVDLPGYGPLQNSSILRGRVSSCIVFKELENGTVDVYMKANFEPNGKVGESVAVLSAANGLIYCSRAVYCAQHKKLAWLLTNRYKRAASVASDLRHCDCATCGKSARKFRRQLTTCQLCRGPMCSTCRVVKRISYIGSGVKEIDERVVPFCKGCVSSTSQKSAFTIAKEEVLSGRWERGGNGVMTTAAMMSVFGLPSEEAIESSSASNMSSRNGRSMSATSRTASAYGDPIELLDKAKYQNLLVPLTPSMPDFKRTFSAYSSCDEDSIDLALCYNEYDDASDVESGSTLDLDDVVEGVPVDMGTLAPQDELYLRMALLRDAAETTYNIAMTNAAAHMTATSSTRGFI
uniref:FYVE-type domain-containing protein n=1 Tax=Globisporangium ultimum (strain ATCC 200006 / CBS 805.95 / DAOM BR144) TaxID=431595 RepID=K3WRW3_GLOUD